MPMEQNNFRERNCVADIMFAANESMHDIPETLTKEFQAPTKTVTWKLIDETNPHYNRWKSSIGYIEAFAKGENPNLTKPFGMSSKTKALIEEE